MNILDTLQQLGEGWKSLVTIAAIVAAGFFAGLTLAGWWRLPVRLYLLEAHQSIVDSLQRDQRAQLVAIKSLLKSQLCLTVADRRHTSWEQCLISDAILKP
jgi:hypothetical protein